MLVALVDIVGLTALIAWGDRLPLGISLVLLALLAASFNSVQHEIIHGHPTPWRRVNDAIGSLPFGVVYPFARYRETHLAHHHDEILTLPGIDPESFYVTAADWEDSSAPRRWLLVSLQTLAGRMVLGPPVYGMSFWRGHVVALRSDRAIRRMVALHVVRAAAFLAIVWVAPVVMWVYLVGAVWAGWSISLVRSFAEHRAGEQGRRTAVVRGGWFSGVLFLHNNLHVTHHERPGLAWYRIPAAFAASDHADRAERGAGLYESYFALARRHLLRPLWSPVHPGPAASGGPSPEPYAPGDSGGEPWEHSTSR